MYQESGWVRQCEGRQRVVGTKEGKGLSELEEGEGSKLGEGEGSELGRRTVEAQKANGRSSECEQSELGRQRVFKSATVGFFKSATVFKSTTVFTSVTVGIFLV